MITELTARGTSASLWHQKKVGETVRTQTFWILISEVLIDDVQNTYKFLCFILTDFHGPLPDVAANGKPEIFAVTVAAGCTALGSTFHVRSCTESPTGPRQSQSK